MKAVVIGATGATGKALVSQLLSNPIYTEVVVLVRKSFFKSNTKLTEVIVDFETLQNNIALIQADIAFSCLGTTLKVAGSKEKQWRVDYDYQYNFAKICSDNKIKTFVLVSAMGASANSMFFYNKIKGTLEDAITQLNFNRLIIMQPGSLIRPESDRFGENLTVKLLLFLNTLGVLRNYRPITVCNLAKAMQIIASKSPKNSVERYNLRAIYNILK